MFVMKKIVTPFFYPLTLSVFFLVAGVMLLLFAKKQRLAKGLVLSGTVTLLLFSYGAGSNLLLEPLEHPYPSLTASPQPSPEPWIVVLGAGLSVDEGIPLTAQLSSTSMVQLAEGIVRYRQRPGSRLLLSGGKGFEQESEADLMARVAVALGVPPSDIVKEDQSRDTEDQARLIREHVGERTFVLVTSASHMHRALFLFRGLGMNPVPAATAHLARAVEPRSPRDVFPKPLALRNAEVAVHEYLGIAWIRLTGLLRMDPS
jgi:uncharacterized SAM-binding protein YcdF (DUF218 family)